MEGFKNICQFLQNNNLGSTLAIFKKQFQNQKDLIKKIQKSKKNFSNISKLQFQKTNPEEVSAVRQFLQKTDQVALNKFVTKLKKNVNTITMIPNENLKKLQSTKIYKRLLQKQNRNYQQNIKVRRLDFKKKEDHDISQIKPIQNNDDSVISKPELVMQILDDDIDEYEDDRDIGYQMYEIPQEQLELASKQLAIKNNFPRKAIASNTSKYPQNYYKSKIIPKKNVNLDQTDHIYLPKNLKFPTSNDSFYPIQYDGIIYDAFELKIVYNQDKTGFQQHKDFQIIPNQVIAGRYKILSVLGQAQFSKAIEVIDLMNNEHYCMKIISNNKDYIDQSIDQIKLLKYINCNANVDEKFVLKYYDYFYFKEHLIIVTQLLKDNLYEAYRLNIKSNEQKYFTLKRIQKISYQILVAMEYIHSLHIIHSDLKPENILMKSYSNSLVKVIDFGSSIFFHDNLSFYLQTRSYRAPQVILGCKYDEKIDIWSVGCILAELYTGRVLFQNDTVVGLLARVQGIIGKWPQWMINKGQLVQKYFTKHMVLFEQVFEQKQNYSQQQSQISQRRKTGYNRIIIPKKTSLKHRLKTDDKYFIDFLKGLLKIDPSERLSASQALAHPFLEVQYQGDE